MYEMENELTDKGTLINELQEKLREIQDRFDLLTADNEKMKQKYLSAKRDLQRKRSKHTRRYVTFFISHTRHYSYCVLELKIKLLSCLDVYI